MKDNISKIVKKVLIEQGLNNDGTSNKEANKIPNGDLKTAFVSGCFPQDTIAYDFGQEGTLLLFQNSKKISGYPMVKIFPQNAGESEGKLEYWDSGLTKKNPGNYKWNCAFLRKLVEDGMNEELRTFVNDVTTSKIARIYTYGDTNVKNTDKVNGTCKLTKLSDFIATKKELGSRADVKSLMEKGSPYIWVCSQGANVTDTIDYWVNTMGYRECTSQDLIAGAASIDQKEVSGVKLCKEKVGAKGVKENPIYTNIVNFTAQIEQGATKEACQGLITNYYEAAQKKLPIPQNEVDAAKDYLVVCRDDVTIKKDNLFNRSFSKKLAELQYFPTYKFRNGTTVSYKLSTGSESQIRESILKKIIRENLNELSEGKKKALIEENNIIQKRFQIIAESGKPKTKKQKEKFADDLIYEMFYLNSQGFNNTLVTEGFMDIVKGLFGNAGEGIFNTLKERFAQFLVEKLTPMDPNGYIANIIVVGVGNVPIGDYFNGKIFKCDYLSDLISKSVGEGIVRKIQNDKGMEGPVYDIIRNSLIETFEDTEFGQKLENFIGDLICPSLSGIQDKMNMAGEVMKEKALS